jgi:hypothetical protein
MVPRKPGLGEARIAGERRDPGQSPFAALASLKKRPK